MNWLIKFFKAPDEIGSVAPSSPRLARLMVRDIQASSEVLEIGPGNGAITQYLLKRLARPEQLTMVEMDAEFVRILGQRFPGAIVILDDAEHILSQTDRSYDFIVSGIPFANMIADKRARMFSLIRDRLKPGGAFIMFQYSILTRGELKKLFATVKTDFTPFNIPPAFVFTCRT